MKKKLYIQTFGCQMNVRDSEQAAALLAETGYSVTENIHQADLIIINTCSIREKAEQKACSFLGRMRKLKSRRSGVILGIIGCFAQKLGPVFFERFPYLSFVCGTHNIHKIPEMVRRFENGDSQISETGFQSSVRSIGIPALPPKGSMSAFVTVMQGCNNFCAYCVVPYLRGREESREADDIVREIQFLSCHGVKEVTLLGQNVNSYGKTLSKGPDFATLLRMVAKVEGIERIRFTTSNPEDLSEALICSFADNEKLCRHIHLPVQAGSNAVLRRMKRRYTAEEYLEKVERLRDICPDISITSDIIVGFPGEEDEDFQKTIDLMEKVRFDSTFSFKYSGRPGTAAYLYSDTIPEPVKRDRLAVLQALQERHTIEKNKQYEGSIADILVEGVSKNTEADVTGRTKTNRIVNFKGNIELIGKIVPVKITEAYAHSLRGELLPLREVKTC